MDAVLEARVRQEAARLQARCHTAVASIRRSDTVADVVRHMRVTVTPELRSLLQRDTWRVRQEAEKRAERILQVHLEELQALSGQDLLARLGQLRAGEWRLLPGNFPRLAQTVNRESTRLASLARQTGAPAAEAFTVMPAHG